MEKGFNCFLKRKFGGIQLNFFCAQSFPCQMRLRESYFGGFRFNPGNLQFVFSGVSFIIFLTLDAKFDFLEILCLSGVQLIHNYMRVVWLAGQIKA